MDALDVGIFEGRHPFAEKLLLNMQNALPPLFESGSGDKFFDQIHHRVFFENPGGSAVRIAINGAGGWVWSGGCDMGQFESDRVGHSVMPCGVCKPHGIVGRNDIKVGCGDVAVIG